MDPIGIRVTQDILRSATQESLSHFHTAGMSGQQDARQRPSIADAMNSKYTNNNSSMTFKLDPHAVQDYRMLKRDIVGRTLKWFVVGIRSNITELPEVESVWYKILGKDMYTGIILRFYIDYARLTEYGLTLSELADISFSKERDRSPNWCVSPDFMGMIDVNMPDNYMSQWLSKMTTRVCGVPEITSCYVQDNLCVTRGSSMLAVSRARNVDKPTITSNNVADVEANLGIEAAACALKDITGSHIISDFMTRTGRVLPFSKNSIEVHRKGLLTSASFERPRDDINNALSSGSKWDSNRVSIYASVMCGKDPCTGFDIIDTHTRRAVDR